MNNSNRIYTKTGDKGMTSLYGGTRIKKSDLKVEVYGTIDEVNTVIGLAKASIKNQEVKELLLLIQNFCFIIAAYFASDEKAKTVTSNKITDEDIEKIENQIDKYNSMLPPLKNFIIPGENLSSTMLHLARTVIRRAERNIIKLKDQEEVDLKILKYINRISDLMFVLARFEDMEEVVQKIKENIISQTTNETLKNREKNIEQLTLELSKKMVQLGIIKAKEIGVNFVFSIVDNHGNLILLERMEDSLLVSIEISQNKAYTAIALKTSTDKLGPLSVPQGPLYGLNHANGGKIITFGGGFPIIYKDKLIGGIGVSGGSVEEDMLVAKECLKIIE